MSYRISLFRYILVFTLVCTSMSLAVAAPFVFSDKPNFSGSTTKYDNWCSRTVDLKVVALERPDIFNPPDSAYLQFKLAKQSSMIMSSICKRVRKITISGWYRGKLYYAGAATKNDNWKLVGIYLGKD